MKNLTVVENDVATKVRTIAAGDVTRALAGAPLLQRRYAVEMRLDIAAWSEAQQYTSRDLGTWVSVYFDENFIRKLMAEGILF